MLTSSYFTCKFYIIIYQAYTCNWRSKHEYIFNLYHNWLCIDIRPRNFGRQFSFNNNNNNNINRQVNLSCNQICSITGTFKTKEKEIWKWTYVFYKCDENVNWMTTKTMLTPMWWNAALCSLCAWLYGFGGEVNAMEGPYTSLREQIYQLTK